MARTAPFVRARSAEQREVRRAAILDTAARMLADGTRVADLSLNELARRVGLAKSNVLRYFESREAVLLDLLDDRYAEWLDAVQAELKAVVSGSDSETGVVRLADVLSRTAAARPMLAELLASSAMVLEHNVSAEIAANYKRRATAQAMQMADLVESALGTLPPPSRFMAAGSINLVVGGSWSICRPSPGMVAAYKQHPELAAMRLDYRIAVREFLATLLTGLLAREVQLS